MWVHFWSAAAIVASVCTSSLNVRQACFLSLITAQNCPAHRFNAFHCMYELVFPFCATHTFTVGTGNGIYKQGHGLQHIGAGLLALDKRRRQRLVKLNIVIPYDSPQVSSAPGLGVGDGP